MINKGHAERVGRAALEKKNHQVKYCCMYGTMAQESRIKMDTTGFLEYEKNTTNLERDT
jgi:hypothetical protein